MDKRQVECLTSAINYTIAGTVDDCMASVNLRFKENLKDSINYLIDLIDLYRVYTGDKENIEDYKSDVAKRGVKSIEERLNNFSKMWKLYVSNKNIAYLLSAIEQLDYIKKELKKENARWTLN